jgi:hypothetical protein
MSENPVAVMLHTLLTESAIANLTVIALWITAVGASAAAVVAMWQAYFTMKVNALLHFEARWTSKEMRRTRRLAAISLLQGDDPPSRHVDRILDFFEALAGIFLKPTLPFDIPIISDEWARHTFYWDAVCYWTKCQAYIEQVQKEEPPNDAWEDFHKLMPQRIRNEGGPPTNESVDGFLEDERDG